MCSICQISPILEFPVAVLLIAVFFGLPCYLVDKLCGYWYRKDQTAHIRQWDRTGK